MEATTIRLRLGLAAPEGIGGTGGDWPPYEALAPLLQGAATATIRQHSVYLQSQYFGKR
jgi:hypothetical protein